MPRDYLQRIAFVARNDILRAFECVCRWKKRLTDYQTLAKIDRSTPSFHTRDSQSLYAYALYTGAASLHPALCYPSPDCTFKIYERHFRPGHNFPRFSGMIANVHVSNLPRDTRIGFVNKSSISAAVNRTRFGRFAYSFQGMPLV